MSILKNANAKSELELEEGMRLYNHGDMANESHTGTLVRLYSDEWGKHAVIEPDNDRDKYEVPQSMIYPEFEGHSGTRIVPDIERWKWKARKVAKLRDVDLNENEELALAKELASDGETTPETMNKAINSA